MKARIAAVVAAVSAAAAAVAVTLAWSRRKEATKAGWTAAPRTEVQLAEAAGELAEAAGGEAEVAEVAAGEAEPAAAEAPTTTADELRSIKGLGTVSERRLHEVGITTFAQIAAWSDEDIEAIAPHIKISAERIRREDWVGQARARNER